MPGSYSRFKGRGTGRGPSAAAIRFFKPLPPSVAARTRLDGVERNRSRILVGRDARLLDRLYRLCPRRTARLIYRKMEALLPR